LQITPIQNVQSAGLFSPLAGRVVTVRGVVTGATRKGYFVQEPDGIQGAGAESDNAVSRGIFVFQRRKRPPVGSLVEVSGKIVDYQPGDNACPSTQLVESSTRVVTADGPSLEPVWLTAERVLVEPQVLAVRLKQLAGMLVGIPAGATFVAPSNPFGDYVLLPPGADLVRTQQGGVLIDPHNPDRWLPGFRLLNYADAPTVHVGAELLEPVVGPLNFRVASYQIAAAGPVRVAPAKVEVRPTSLGAVSGTVTVLTLNGFNLDPHKEDPAKVNDPGRDVDDDVGDGRFLVLGHAIVHDAGSPAIIALQEIQDDDGAELSTTVKADRTFAVLVRAVQAAGGPTYAWADIPPQVGVDGGQPGGNIRNAYLYDPARVHLVPGSLARLGSESPAFESSRKPLAARFSLVDGQGELELINVHLASKRHQNGLFAPDRPGFDSRLALRVRQAEVIGEHLARLRAKEVDYYVTGDFNDFEFSPTLRALTGDHSTNLVERVPEPLRYDYNHRGMSQALMHGVVANRQMVERTVEYEILHANALLGAQPGRKGEKASDHAYVIARLELA
jgi:predicted extracellular nuclease